MSNIAPICENCEKTCSISGTPRVGSNLNYWTCFTCGYKVEEIEFEECSHEWIMTADSFDQTCYCKKCGKSS